MSMAGPTTQKLGPCPCEHRECPAVGTKLTKYGCLVGCNEPSCRGRRSRRKGRAAQARSYRTLGGSAPFSPTHEENSGTFSVEIQVESKAGKQVPRQLVAFTRSEWARRAWSQAERAIPAGVQAHPAIYTEPEGGGRYLIVKL